MSAPIVVTEISDPGCPWAYSAAPALAALRWRYGDQLDWRLSMIGLAETPEQYEQRGFTLARMATGYVSFRRYGMPFDTSVRERLIATGRPCRAIVAARLKDPLLGYQVFRALQIARFTTPVLFDTDAGIRTALAGLPGLDTDALIAAIDSAAVEQAYQADRALARTAAGSPTELQGKTANSDGAVRYTAPSLLFEAADGRKLEAGGFQPLEAYDVVIANLDPRLERRAPSADVVAVLAASAFPLTVAEVAAAMALDAAAAEVALIEAAVAGSVVREAVGGGALWRAL